MDNTLHKKILLCAGEASGDLLGGNLISAIQKINPNIEYTAMGGKKMQAAGADIIIDAEKLAVVGFVEIIKHFPDIKAAFKRLKQEIKTNRPDLIILIDYPGFNLRMAKIAKKAGIKVLFYVSPQIWAWRYGRIKKIKKYVDHMAVLFKFEEDMYLREHMPATFVGHPLVAEAKPNLSKEESYATLGLDSDKPIIALFPGSRMNEITRLMPIMMDTITLLKQQCPNVQFAMPLASSLREATLQSLITHDEVKIIHDNTYNLLQISNVAIAASGTATLEIALNQIPLVIIYTASKLTAWIVRMVIRLDWIGLCNIVAQEKVAQELLQEDASPAKITEEVLRLLNDTPYRQSILDKLQRLPSKLGESNGSVKAAELTLELLQ